MFFKCNASQRPSDFPPIMINITNELLQESFIKVLFCINNFLLLKYCIDLTDTSGYVTEYMYIIIKIVVRQRIKKERVQENIKIIKA